MVDRGEIKALTGLRGVAALFVVTYHYFDRSNVSGPAGIFLRHGYMAVDLFFVLSGFVMSLNYAGRFAGEFGTRAYVDFLHKRLGRILPLYLCLFAATIPTCAPVSTYDLFVNAVMIQGWGLGGTLAGPSWSISTEFTAYLLFPALVWAALSPGASRAWVCAGVACAALVVAGLQSPAAVHEICDGVVQKNGPLDIYNTVTAFPLLRCLGGFTLGMLGYRLASLPRVVRLARGHGASLLVAAAVLAAVAIPRDDVALVLLFVPLVIVLAVQDSLLARALSRPVVHWLGLVSYSVYLTHRLVQSLLLIPLDNALLPAHVPHAYSVATVLVLVATVAVSAATYYGIERPARDWARRLIQRRPPPIEAEPSAP